MKTIYRMFFILIMSLSFNGNAATLIFDDGFESGNLNKYNPQLAHSPYASFTIISSPVATGSKAGKLDLIRQSTSLDNYRSEFVLNDGKGYFNFDQEYWFSFKYRYEDWVKDSAAEIAPFQIHTRPSSWDGACNLGSAVTTAPFLMMSQDDKVQFRTYGGKVMWSATIQKKQWSTITVRFKISMGSGGYVEAWKDGVRLGQVNGANSPALDKCNKPMKTTYLKIGTYKWPWRINRPSTQSSRRTILIDDLKIAIGSNGYSLVTSTPTSPPPAPTPTPVVFQLSNITAVPSAVSSKITWNTSLAADTTVEYGTTTSYGLTASGAGSTLDHSVELVDLIPGQIYHYRVKSRNSDGLLLTSTDKTFTTSLSTLSGLVSDNFDGALNTSVWEFYNPAGDSSTSNANGIQSIINPANIVHDLYIGNLNAPRIRQITANTNMTLEVKFRSNPTQTYQAQGITIEQDNNNLIRFDILKSGSGVLAYSGTVSANGTVFKKNYSQLISNPSNTYWIRVTRYGDLWTHYYSQDGTNWIKVKELTYALTATKVGIHSLNAGTPTPAFTALVDYFKADNVEPPAPVTEPPVITNIVLTPGKNSIDYSYTTDTASSTKSIHNFSCSTSVGSINNDPTLVTSHSGTLSGLIPETQYRIQLCSADSDGRERCSPIQNTTTTE